MAVAFWIAEIQNSAEMEDKIRSRRFVDDRQRSGIRLPHMACTRRSRDGPGVPQVDEFAEFDTDEATFDGWTRGAVSAWS